MKIGKAIFFIIIILMIEGVIYMAHNKVYGYCENFCKEEVMTKGETLAQIAANYEIIANNFYELTGNLTFNNEPSKSIDIQYPTGYTSSNTYVIAAMITKIPNGTENYVAGSVPQLVYLPQVSLYPDRININAIYSNNMTGTFKYKVLLFKNEFAAG